MTTDWRGGVAQGELLPLAKGLRTSLRIGVVAAALLGMGAPFAITAAQSNPTPTPKRNDDGIITVAGKPFALLKDCPVTVYATARTEDLDGQRVDLLYLIPTNETTTVLTVPDRPAVGPLRDLHAGDALPCMVAPNDATPTEGT